MAEALAEEAAEAKAYFKSVNDWNNRVKTEMDFPEKYEPTKVEELDATSLKKPVGVPYHLPWRRRTGIIARKMGMMGIYDEWGVRHPVTVFKLDSQEVVQAKQEQCPRRGFYSLQVGEGGTKIRKVPAAQLGHYAKHGVAPKKVLREFQVSKEALMPPGTPISVRHFLVGQRVDVQGVTQDKGFQGVMKRWGFKGGQSDFYGSTKFHRRPGSMGGCQDPGKVWKGKKLPGHMGLRSSTQENSLVMRIDASQNLLYVRGSFPGRSGFNVRISDSYWHPPANPPFPTFFPDPEEAELPGPIDFNMWGDRNPMTELSEEPDEWENRNVSDLPP